MKIILRICFIVISVSVVYPGDSGRYWIFFTDKQDYRLNQLSSDRLPAINERAIERRKLRASKAIFDDTDLQVSVKYIKKLNQLGLAVHGQSKWLNAVSVSMEQKKVKAVLKLPFVHKVQPVQRYLKIAIPESEHLSLLKRDLTSYGNSLNQNQMIGVPFAHDLGFAGEGVLIALLDTGFELRHSALQHINVVASRDFINDDAIVANEPGDHPSQHNHGTIVLSVMAGYAPGQLIGPAYEADFLLAKTDDLINETYIDEDNWIAAAEWAEAAGADIISSSVGYTLDYEYSDMDGESTLITRVADIAVRKGVAVFVAAGNEGYTSWKHIVAPSDGDSVVAVGGVRADGSHWPGSSIGPSFDGRIKPDLMAQSQSVYAVLPNTTDAYTTESGTSVSCPLAAGAVAILLSARNTLSPVALRDTLLRYASHYENPNNLFGYGIIDLEGALQSILPKPGVAVSHFTVENLEGKNIISWQADEEIDNDVWIIKRKQAGEFYRRLAEINGRNFGLDPKKYSYYDLDVSGGEMFIYELTAQLTSGVLIVIDSMQTQSLLPGEITHYEIFPNPFNSSTKISFGLQLPQKVSLGVYNIRGQLIRTLVDNRQLAARFHNVIWNGLNNQGFRTGSGTYYVLLKFGKTRLIKKLVYLN